MHTAGYLPGMSFGLHAAALSSSLASCLLHATTTSHSSLDLSVLPGRTTAAILALLPVLLLSTSCCKSRQGMSCNACTCTDSTCRYLPGCTALSLQRANLSSLSACTLIMSLAATLHSISLHCRLVHICCACSMPTSYLLPPSVSLTTYAASYHSNCACKVVSTSVGKCSLQIWKSTKVCS